MSTESGRRGWWQRVATFFGSNRHRDWRLHVPPEPPLLTTDAVHALLREVGLLLDYLNRLPDSRLQQYFVPKAQQLAPSPSAPIPPCESLSYFLGRIGAIAGREPDTKPNAITHPSFPHAADAPEQPPAGCGEAVRLGDFAFLVWTRDFLSSVAHPATLDTIRVTRAYRAHRTVGGRVEEGASRHTTDERDLFMSRYGFLIAGRVRWFTWLAVGLLWFSMYVSYLVYSGQILTTETATLLSDEASHGTRVKEAATQEEALIQAAISANKIAGPALLSLPYCNLPIPTNKIDVLKISGPAAATAPAGTVPPEQLGRLFVSDRHRALCAEQNKLERRHDELESAYGSWWTHAILLRWVTRPAEFLSAGRRIGAMLSTPANPPDKTQAKPADKTESKPADKKWTRTLETYRYLMQQMINGLLAGIMPAIYAALGALASLFRRLAQKVENERLGPSDYSGMLASLVLGVLMGAVIGLFSNVLQGGQNVALPLSTTALALLAGYATDRVFDLFDNLSKRVFEPPQSSAAPARPT